MFKKALTISTVVALLTVGSMAKGHGGESKGKGHNSQEATVALSDMQKEGLVFMAEEEKVARDVYLHLSDTWGERVFSNIAKSEQRHMDAVERLINQYELELPSTMEHQGVFENEELQAMYDELIEKGDSSLNDALEVGVAIEEKDIADLEELLAEETPSQLEKVYGKLLDGSFKHLDAFNRQLSK
jgi:hypothetical protein